MRRLRPHLLLVEDDESARSGYAELLRNQGFDVVEVASAAEALSAAARQRPDLVLLDVRLPDGDGLALAETLRDRFAETPFPIIAFTGFWTAESAGRAQACGVFTTLMKPTAPAHLLAEIYRALADPEGGEQTPSEQ